MKLTIAWISGSLGILYGMSVLTYGLLMCLFASSWQRVGAVVEQIEPLDGATRRGFLYDTPCRVKFRYTFDGKIYYGNRATFFDVFGVFFLYGRTYRDLMKSFVISKASGQEISIFVNPNKPSKSVAFKGVPTAHAVGLVAGVVFCVVLLVLIELLQKQLDA